MSEGVLAAGCIWERDLPRSDLASTIVDVVYVFNSATEENNGVVPAEINSASEMMGQHRGVDTHLELRYGGPMWGARQRQRRA